MERMLGQGVAIMAELSNPPDRLTVDRGSESLRANIRWHDNVASINWPLVFKTDHIAFSVP